MITVDIQLRNDNNCFFKQAEKGLQGGFGALWTHVSWVLFPVCLPHNTSITWNDKHNGSVSRNTKTPKHAYVIRINIHSLETQMYNHVIWTNY